MHPRERKLAVDIVTKYGENSFDLACVDEIHETLKIPFSDMDNLRVCVYIGKEHPETLDYDVGQPNWEAINREKVWDLDDDDPKLDINRDLSYFQRIPTNSDGVILLHGDKLFEHMIRYRNMICSKDGRLEPSKYLDLEISSDQSKILFLAEHDLRRSTIFKLET